MPRQAYGTASRSSNIEAAQAGCPVKSRAAPGKRKEEETKARSLCAGPLHRALGHRESFDQL